MGQVLPTHLMEERLIRQQQEMEEDQRWLEKEERFLVMVCFVVTVHSFIHSNFSLGVQLVSVSCATDTEPQEHRMPEGDRDLWVHVVQSLLK